MAHYLDTSALVKLVVAERESPALRAWLLEEERTPVTCDLARTELYRAVKRSAPDRAVQARAVLDSLTVLRLDSSTFDSAGRLEPSTLRTLDALHLAAALTLGDDLETIVTYDEHQATAAKAHGVACTSPR